MMGMQGGSPAWGFRWLSMLCVIFGVACGGKALGLEVTNPDRPDEGVSDSHPDPLPDRDDLDASVASPLLRCWLALGDDRCVGGDRRWASNRGCRRGHVHRRAVCRTRQGSFRCNCGDERRLAARRDIGRTVGFEPSGGVGQRAWRRGFVLIVSIDHLRPPSMA